MHLTSIFFKCLLKKPIFLEHSLCARTVLRHLPALPIESSCGSFLGKKT